MKITREIIGVAVLFGFVLTVLGVIMALVVSTIATTNFNARATVLTSNQYTAGTIVGGETLHQIGYNITFTYNGAVGHATILCPLYPVGAKIPAVYSNVFWLYPKTELGNLPAGCITPSILN